MNPIREHHLDLILAANIRARLSSEGGTVIIEHAGIPILKLTANASEALAEQLITAARETDRLDRSSERKTPQTPRFWV